MRTAIRISIISAIVFFLVSGALFAQDLKEFENPEYRYSLQYPGSWHLADDENFELYSTEDLENEGVDGAALIVQVMKLELNDVKAGGDPLKRAMKSLNSEIEYTLGKPRNFAGREWQSVQFKIEKMEIGQAYCTVNDFRIYLIVCGYTNAGNEKKYRKDIEKMITSFKFSDVVYKRINDNRLGISFEYPSHWSLQEQAGMGYMIMTDKSASDTNDVMAGIALMVAPKKEIGMSVDDMIKQITSYNKVILGPEERNIAGFTWTYMEVKNDHSRMTAAIRENGDTMIVIATVVNPADFSSHVDEVFLNFFNSLEF